MGRAFVFGDNIDTDLIVPGQYLACSEPKELARVCMAGYEEGFAGKIAAGDVFVAGNNFGCGSSREHAPVSIKAAGLACVIARSFARIFYRNAINIGLPVLESPEAVAGIRPGDAVEVAFDQGIIRNLTTDESYRFAPFTPLILEVIAAGGMVGYVQGRKAMAKKGEQKGVE